MSIKQMSVFLENRLGALAEFTAFLAEKNIDLFAMSLADTTDFGIVRTIVDDTDRALALVKEQGYTANVTPVLAVAVQDTPGGLSSALAALHEGNVSIEYLYSFVRRVNHNAVIIFRVSDAEGAERILLDKGLSLLGQEEIGGAKGS